VDHRRRFVEWRPARNILLIFALAAAFGGAARGDYYDQPCLNRCGTDCQRACTQTWGPGRDLCFAECRREREVCQTGCRRAGNPPCPANCPSGSTCGAGGVCTCHPGLAPCGSRCVDVQTDAQNCGACGSGCPSGATCSGGACGPCQPGLTMCGGACVDTSSDPMNCGACGAPCPSAATCRAATCGCPPGMTTCGGRCTNVTRDPKNCGACGFVCSRPGFPYCCAGCLSSDATRPPFCSAVPL
jgi:hypothetical protein